MHYVGGMETAISPVDKIRKDGRHGRKTTTCAKIMVATRKLMAEGIFRPDTQTVARTAEVSVRSIFAHYRDAEEMRLAALDGATMHDVLSKIFGQNWDRFSFSEETITKLCRAIVAGRIVNTP